MLIWVLHIPEFGGKCIGYYGEEIRSWNIISRNKEELWRSIQQGLRELKEEGVRNDVEWMYKGLADDKNKH